MYEIIYTGQFKRSLKRCVKRGLDVKAFTDVLDILQDKGELPAEYQPHKLHGNSEAVGNVTYSLTGY